MGVKSYDIKELAFDLSEATQYELSILLGMGSFTYIIRSIQNKMLMVYRSINLDTADARNWSDSIQQLIQDDDILRSGLIKNCHISWVTNRASLVPIRLFEIGKESEYLSQLTTVSLQNYCKSEALPALGTQLVYTVNADNFDSATKRFTPKSNRHFAGRLLQSWQDQNRKIGQRAVYACLRDNQITIASMDAGKLIFFNVFPFKTAQDALYFSTLSFQQSGWGLDRVPLYLCGEILPQSEVYRHLYRFIEDIRFLSIEDQNGLLGEKLGTYPSHIYYDLLCQYP